MYLHEMGQRECDDQGCGYYGASRGSRKHVGVDLTAADNTSLPIGTDVQCGFSGEVVKVGLAYSQSDKRHLRYVAIKLEKYYVRVFYIEPKVSVGDIITADTVIGKSLCLGDFYKNITEHVHFEVYTLKDHSKGIHNKRNFRYINPNVVLEVLRKQLNMKYYE